MRMASDIYQVLFTILLTSIAANSISNTKFNSNIRDYSDSDNTSNLTNVKTLQKEDVGTYVSFTPARNAVSFKEIPDSALSSTSYSRGLLHNEHPGYVLNDYEEIPAYSFGNDYQTHDDQHNHHHDHKYHLDQHDYKHHYDHHDSGHNHYSGHHSLDHGYHHKHYNHALAAKTILWPIAGIALLGAAAALVSNPILLQLGVVSGRRRRDTNDRFNPELLSEYQKYPKKDNVDNSNVVEDNSEDKDKFKRRMLKWNVFKKVKHGEPKKVLAGIQKSTKVYSGNPNSHADNVEDGFIPIPLLIKT